MGEGSKVGKVRVKPTWESDVNSRGSLQTQKKQIDIYYVCVKRSRAGPKENIQLI